mmetsp:Transcript_22957/g.66438  ORF Transcript_22957/g.66438 Transcript_22957/m.66438 type:complete len:171 (-) Transcript_22957:103-615(-)
MWRRPATPGLCALAILSTLRLATAVAAAPDTGSVIAKARSMEEMMAVAGRRASASAAASAEPTAKVEASAAAPAVVEAVRAEARAAPAASAQDAAAVAAVAGLDDELMRGADVVRSSLQQLDRTSAPRPRGALLASSAVVGHAAESQRSRALRFFAKHNMPEVAKMLGSQ